MVKCLDPTRTMRGSIAGFTETLKGKNTYHYAFLCVLDTFLSAFLVAPLVVGYWRSVWELMQVYVYPDDLLCSALISTGIGVIGHVVFTVTQKLFEDHLHPDKNRICYYVFSRIYTVCFAFVCVNGWRGPWLLVDRYTSRELETVLATTVVGIVALGGMKTLRNVSAPPCTLMTDFVTGYFQVLTMFKISMTQKTSLYILDCLFSVLVVGTLVVFVWRGAWALIDLLLFPNDEHLSALSSLILGYAVVLVSFLLQTPMKWVCERLEGAPRLFAADVFLCFSLLGTINVWRGIWNLLNLYFLPDNLELSCWITHWVSLVLLILLGCSNSLLVRGVYIDAEEPAGKCVVFPCYYLRLIFQQERQKKNAKKVQLDVIGKRKQDLDNTISDKIPDGNHITTMNQYTEPNHHAEV